MFLLAWFVWLGCSMSGSPDVGYTTVPHYTLSGELYTFPACPLDRTCVAALPTLKRLQTWVRPNFYCLGLALCNHLHHDSMFYTHSLPQYASDWLGSLVLPTGRAFFFPLRLEEGTILHDLTLVFQFSRPEPRAFLAPNRGDSFPDTRGFLQEKLRLRQSLVLFYAAIGIYYWFLFNMLYSLRKIFRQYRKPTLFIWIARRDYGSTGHDFCFLLHKLYKLHGSFCSRFSFVFITLFRYSWQLVFCMRSGGANSAEQHAFLVTLPSVAVLNSISPRQYQSYHNNWDVNGRFSRVLQFVFLPSRL